MDRVPRVPRVIQVPQVHVEPDWLHLDALDQPEQIRYISMDYMQSCKKTYLHGAMCMCLRCCQLQRGCLSVTHLMQ